MQSKSTFSRRFARNLINPFFVAGAVLLLLGSGPLTGSMLRDWIHGPDSDNALGFGLLFIVSFPLAILALFIGLILAIRRTDAQKPAA